MADHPCGVRNGVRVTQADGGMRPPETQWAGEAKTADSTLKADGAPAGGAHSHPQLGKDVVGPRRSQWDVTTGA